MNWNFFIKRLSIPELRFLKLTINKNKIKNLITLEKNGTKDLKKWKLSKKLIIILKLFI